MRERHRLACQPLAFEHLDKRRGERVDVRVTTARLPWAGRRLAACGARVGARGELVLGCWSRSGEGNEHGSASWGERVHNVFRTWKEGEPINGELCICCNCDPSATCAPPMLPQVQTQDAIRASRGGLRTSDLCISGSQEGYACTCCTQAAAPGEPLGPAAWGDSVACRLLLAQGKQLLGTLAQRRLAEPLLPPLRSSLQPWLLPLPSPAFRPAPSP